MTRDEILVFRRDGTVLCETPHSCYPAKSICRAYLIAKAVTE